jgi:hypothetical protein
MFLAESLAKEAAGGSEEIVISGGHLALVDTDIPDKPPKRHIGC